MTRQLLKRTIFPALLLVFISTQAQVKTSLPKETVTAPGVLNNRHPKLVKTLKTNQFGNIQCGLQDKAGNLWFATTGEGVYRFDGKYFTQFTSNDGLSNNIVWRMAEDKAGNIWFGTDNGICRYDGITIRPVDITNGDHFHLNNNAAKNDVWSIMQDKSGMLWFGTRNGVYCYDGKSFSRFLGHKAVINKGNLHLKMIDCMLEDKNGNIWFASGMGPGQEGICRYNPRTGELTSQKPYGNGWIRTVMEDKTGNLYIATRLNGVCRYDTATGEFINISKEAGIQEGTVTNIFPDSRGNVWIATEGDSGRPGENGGVWRYDGKSFTRFTTKDGLIHNDVWCVLEDKSGNMWFGTRNIGLCRYNGKTFTHFSE